MQRGEVWLATIDDRAAVIVLSVRHDLIRAIRVVPPAAQLIEGVMREMTLGDSAGLASGVVRIAIPRAGFIPCQWLVNLSETDLVERLGQLSIDKLAELDELLRLAELELES